MVLYEDTTSYSTSEVYLHEILWQHVLSMGNSITNY